jgi:hypothetical protein
MKALCACAIVLLVCVCPAFPENDRLARIEVEAGAFGHLNVPVSAGLEGIDFNPDRGGLVLVELRNGERIAVPCQLEQGFSPRLWWILDGSTPAGGKRLLELFQGSAALPAQPIETAIGDEDLIVARAGRKILQYRHAPLDPPPGISPLFRRSGFIHPLYSPKGAVLTRVQPPDHHHHVGIWNPWTRTRWEGREVDFWNLGEGQGTVRFAGLLSVIAGPVFGGFKVHQEHVDLLAGESGRVAMNEVWEVRAWNHDSGGAAWLWDFAATLSCATPSPIELQAYRYGGGLGFRASEEWTRENVQVRTSEGKGRQEADGSRARWCRVSGESREFGRSGILFMSHPANREHPEPMRVWPEDANEGRGDLFFEFCPIRHNSWNLEPGREYVLRYRMLVYDGDISDETAEQLWRDFAAPPRVTVRPHRP